MYFVYVIRSLDKNYIYVGISDNVERRVAQHNSGYEKTTRPYKPFNLILIEQFSDRISARRREKFLKSGIGKTYLKSIT